jgi:hypothetical protein
MKTKIYTLCSAFLPETEAVQKPFGVCKPTKPSKQIGLAGELLMPALQVAVGASPDLSHPTYLRRPKLAIEQENSDGACSCAISLTRAGRATMCGLARLATRDRGN